MTSDKIIEIGIDDLERLYIKPKEREFLYIYRSAMEVHWDTNRKYLYSPKPREWTYLRWFIQIIEAVKDQYCLLSVTNNTKWVNISDELKSQIKEYSENDLSVN